MIVQTHQSLHDVRDITDSWLLNCTDGSKLASK